VWSDCDRMLVQIMTDQRFATFVPTPGGCVHCGGKRCLQWHFWRQSSFRWQLPNSAPLNRARRFARYQGDRRGFSAARISKPRFQSPLSFSLNASGTDLALASAMILPRRGCRALAHFLLVCLIGSDALAQESDFAKRRTNVVPYRVKLRTTLPFTQIRVANPGSTNGSNVGASLLGASVEAEYRQLWAIEMGGAAVVEAAPSFPVGADVFVRGGLVPVVYDASNSDGRGWIVQFDALAGYRWLRRERSGGDADSGTEQTHAIRWNLGFDFTRQFSIMALDVRFLSGLTLPLAHRRTGDWQMHSPTLTPSDDLKWALDFGVELGITL